MIKSFSRHRELLRFFEAYLVVTIFCYPFEINFIPVNQKLSSLLRLLSNSEEMEVQELGFISGKKTVKIAVTMSDCNTDPCSKQEGGGWKKSFRRLLPQVIFFIFQKPLSHVNIFIIF